MPTVLLLACGHLAAPTGPGGGSPAALAFGSQPITTTAGQTIPAVQVQAKDAAGKLTTNFSGAVTIAFSANPGSDTLAGATTVNAVAGVATFSNLRIDRAASGYRLIATSGSLAPATSSRFDVVGGHAMQLAFTVQPATTTAGKSFSPTVKATAEDSLGNADASFVGAVTVAIETNPSGGTISGGTTVSAAAGVASFPGLSIDKAGAGYTLSVTASGLSGATSNSFAVVPGSATHLIFTVQPSSTTAGGTITPAVELTALDTAGNIATGYIGNVYLTITGGSGTAGASLSGPRTIAAVAGVATFSALSINLSGTGYTLTATGSGVTGTISAPFDIGAAAADSLVFTVQPTTTTAGQAITPAVNVSATDSLGNVVTSFTGNVTVAIAPGTGRAGANLTGTKTVTAIAGVATFSSLKIDSSGTGYRLSATATGLAGTTSAAFAITAGMATKLVFTVQPTTTSAGKTISPSVRVAAVDAVGNTDPTFVGNVTVAIGHNPSGGNLSGTLQVAAFGGVAPFSTLSIDKAGTGYTLTAAATGLTGATSAAFDISSGSATQFAFTGQPHNATAGTTITPAVQVTALDVAGNPATGFTGNVTVAITAGTGTAGATLGGTRSVAAVAGVATFSTLSINLAGTGYTLAATGGGLTPGVSNAFNIAAAPADSLVFTTQPTTITAGQAITPAVQVSARDSLGNVASSFTGSVTVAIAPGTGTQGANLTGTKTVSAVAGVATFSTLKIDSAGTGYRLMATTSASGVSGTTSAAFSITAGTATKLIFSVQPSTTVAGKSISPAVKVTAVDALGNTNSAFSGNVTVAIGTNPGGGSLGGTLTVAAFGGVASFSTLSIDKVGVGYTLKATATGLTSAVSSAFTITAASASLLVFSVVPSNTAAGGTITPAVEVTARDAFGNTATGFGGNVTVAIGTNPSGGTLAGTTVVGAVAGVATFSTLSINLAGMGYTLTASGGGLTPATSPLFNIQ